MDTPKRVFLSYSYDSPEHAQRILYLADALQRGGLEVLLDQYVHPAPDEGWPRWMESGIDEADFVLMVCTEHYHRRVMGHKQPDKGLGVRWEGTLIYNRIYSDKPSGSRFIPVLLEGSDPAHIPNPVQGHSYYRIRDFDVSDLGYESLYRHLTGQAPTPPPERGPVQILRPRPRRVPPSKSSDSSQPARDIADTGDRLAGHCFISYSSVDCADFAQMLAAGLAGGEPSVKVWIDKQHLHPGIAAYDFQIDEAIKTCKCLLFIMTQDSVIPTSNCALEWYAALKYKRPIIPIRYHLEAMKPFLLGPLPDLDFTDSFDAALARLRAELAWLDTPEAALQALRHRLAAARHDLPRADPQQRPRIEEEIKDLEQQIADQQRVVDDPVGASQRTKERIAEGLASERRIESPSTSPSRVKFIGKPPTVAPSWFQDRHVETAQIGDFLKDDPLRLMTVVGRAGIGKTAMVCRLLKSLEQGQLPDDGGPLDVDGIVYLSATGSHRVRITDLFVGLCQLVPEARAWLIEGVSQNPNISTETKLQTLLEALPGERTVVLMDNFEDVLDTATGEIRDSELEETLRAVLMLPQHGLKVILTTQLAPRSLLLEQPGRHRPLSLDTGLDYPHAENMLRAMDKDGTVGFKDAPASLLAEARELTRGYPRALEALFNILKADRYTTLKEVLSDARRLPPEELVEVLVGKAFSRLDPLAQQVMQALAIYPRPVPPTAVDYLLQPYQPGINSEPVLRRLVGMQFARRDAGHYYLHHVDRAYALSRVPDGRLEDWRGPEGPPYTRHTLLHRGAEYFRTVRRDKSDWTSLEDIGPLNSEFDLLIDSGDHDGALEVLDAMVPYLKRWGQNRLEAQLSERLARGAKEPVRSAALAIAGVAHASLGETSRAIEIFKEVLEARRPEVNASQVKLRLAACYYEDGNHDAAELEYRHVHEAAEKDDVESLVAALLGLGSVAHALSSYAKAEEYYQRALHTWVSQMIAELVPDGEKISVRFGSTDPPDLAMTVPGVWHPLPFSIDLEEEGEDKVTLFGIELPTSEPEGQRPERSPGGEEYADSERIQLLPVGTTSLLADIWLNLASVYRDTDRVSEASDCCYLAGLMYGAVGNDSGTGQARDLLRRLIAQVAGGVAESIFAAHLEAQEEDLRRARVGNNRLLEISILSNLAGSYLERSKVDEAEACYHELANLATQLDDPSLETRVELGLARIEWVRERPDVALARLEKLLKVRPQPLPTRTEVEALLGSIEIDRNRQDAATAHLLAASRGYAELGALPDLIDIECRLATLARDRRDYEIAVRRLQLVLKLAKGVGTPSLITDVLCELADAYYWAGARDEALAAADEAATTAIKNKLPATEARARMAIGELRLQLGQFELAEIALLQAKEAFRTIGDNYKQIRVLFNLSRLYGKTKRMEAQLSVARQAWAMANDLADPAEMRAARMELALALSDCGFHAEAAQNAQAVVDISPNDAAAFVNLGHVLLEAGDFDRSLRASRRALEIDSTQTVAIRNLGHAYLSKGLPDDAEREYRRAIQDRRGGEDLFEPIKTVKKILARNPQVLRGHELLELLEQEQAKLDAGKKSGEKVNGSPNSVV
jgi:tetratricopeptide (TPR) repeat protein